MIDKRLIQEIENRKTCIFEFDGTIADTRADHRKACESVLLQMNVKISEAVKKKYEFQTDLQYFKMVIKDYKLNVSASECVERKKQEFAEITTKKGMRVFPFVKEISDLIKDKRNVIITALPSAVIKSVLEKQGLERVFSNIWSLPEFGASKVSTIREMPKYDPIYFDDTNKYLTVARENKIVTAGIIHSLNKDVVLDCDYIIDTTKGR